jgi:multimeric flavodoxin WrbA
MNIVAIYSSPRKRSITSCILTEIINNIPSYHKVESFDINKLKIKPCTGCLQCRPDKECVLPYDDAHLLADRIRTSDLIIIGAPTYWGNIPGTLKIFFDRCVTTFEYAEAKAVLKPPKPLLKGKKCIIITSSGSPFPYNQLLSQSRGAIKALKSILKAGGIKIIKIINVANAYAFEKNSQKYLLLAKKIGLSIT